MAASEYKSLSQLVSACLLLLFVVKLWFLCCNHSAFACLKSIMETPEQRVNFSKLKRHLNDINGLVLVSLLLTFNRFYISFGVSIFIFYIYSFFYFKTKCALKFSFKYNCNVKTETITNSHKNKHSWNPPPPPNWGVGPFKNWVTWGGTKFFAGKGG